MALRDQPYLPLYIQDFLTDEKLNECSAASVGVYIKIMCLLHKSKEYGTFLLKQKDKQIEQQSFQQKDKQLLFFSLKFAKLLPFNFDVIYDALEELILEKVLYLEGDFIIQNRMVKDNKLSITRSKSGKSGGKKAQQNKLKLFASFATAKTVANAEIEDDINNVLNYSIEKGNMKKEITTKITGLGEFKIIIYTVCDEKELLQLERFLTNSQKAFETLVMTRPYMKSISNFQAALQHFVTSIQEKSNYQEAARLRDHFINWLNTQNGSLEKVIAASKVNSVSEEDRIDHDEYMNGSN